MKRLNYLPILSIIIVSTIFLLNNPAKAEMVNITSYDILNTPTDGFGGWHHTYNGTIDITTPEKVLVTDNSGTNYPGSLANYSEGQGTLNDGITGTGIANTQLFATNYAPEIKLYFDQSYLLDNITLFSHEGGSGSTVTGNITYFNITAGTTTLTFASESASEDNHEFATLAGTLIGAEAIDCITISSFQTGGLEPYFMAISEIRLQGTPIPIPGAVWLLGTGLCGLVAIKRRFKK